MRNIFKFIYRIYARIFYRPKLIGKENIPKESGAIICPNHIHAMDSVTIVAFTKRKLNCLAKEELFNKGIAKWFAKVVGIYTVKRESADIQAIKISLKLLKNKELLMIFPEGTRNGMAKGIKPKNGAITIATKANVPIIPIGIKGNFKPFKKVIINIGKPIYYSNYKETIKDKEVANNLTKELMNEIVKLRDK